MQELHASNRCCLVLRQACFDIDNAMYLCGDQNIGVQRNPFVVLPAHHSASESEGAIAESDHSRLIVAASIPMETASAIVLPSKMA